MKSEPNPEAERFGSFGPALRDWLEFVHDCANVPWAALPLMAALCALVVDRTGRVDMARLDRRALQAAHCGHKALRMCLVDFQAEGFIRWEGSKVWLRSDIAAELMDARAAIRRADLRVMPGGKLVPEDGA